MIFSFFPAQGVWLIVILELFVAGVLLMLPTSHHTKLTVIIIGLFLSTLQSHSAFGHLRFLHCHFFAGVVSLVITWVLMMDLVLASMMLTLLPPN